MSNDEPGRVTGLLKAWKQGDRAALNELIPLVESELRRVARKLLRRERPDHTLQPTALVHEAYLRLIESDRVDWHDRTHFFGVTARIMRQILVDHARRHAAAKRGGGSTRITFDEEIEQRPGWDVDVVALHEVLEQLSQFDERLGRIVELRFFAGLTVDETAEVLGISPATMKREWTIARAWLYRQLRRN